MNPAHRAYSVWEIWHLAGMQPCSEWVEGAGCTPFLREGRRPTVASHDNSCFVYKTKRVYGRGKAVAPAGARRDVGLREVARRAPEPPDPEQPEEDDDTELARTSLYLVEIVGVCVKVGISTEPVKRIATHRRMAEQVGGLVGRTWCSPPHFEAADNERVMKSAEHGEWLRMGFDEALQAVKALPMTQSRPWGEQ